MRFIQCPAMPDPYDPNSYRMTIGEHLEELRWRLMLGLGAFLAIAIVFGLGSGS